MERPARYHPVLPLAWVLAASMVVWWAEPSAVPAVLPWLALIGLVSRLIDGRLSRPWLVWLAAFLLIPVLDGSAPAACWMVSGLFHAAVYGVWMALRAYYRGEALWPWLLVAGLLTGLSVAAYPLGGGLLGLALAMFGWLNQFLHEREEKNLMTGQVSNRKVWHRWLRSWGLQCLLPAWAVWVLLSGWVSPVLGEHSGPMGYFGAFQSEWLHAWQPLRWQSPLKASYLLLTGVLPLIGLLHAGNRLTKRLMYRLLLRSDEDMLLLWLGATALIAATFAHGHSGFIISNGPLALMLALSAIQEKIPRPGWPGFMYAGLLLLMTLLGH